MDAAATIRARIEALPEGFRLPWEWSAGSNQVRPAGDENRAYVVASCGFATSADYIALMDPTVGEALANLLDAERSRRAMVLAWQDGSVYTSDLTRAEQREGEAFDALERAIFRTERSEG